MKKLFYLLLFFTAVLGSCKKEDDPEPEIELPTVSTSAITNITRNSATGGGNISSDGGAGILDKGVIFATQPNPEAGHPSTRNTNDGAGLGPFTSSITTDVVPNTTYYVKAWARNQKGTAYGAQVTFTTLALSAPTVTTSTLSNITNNSANGGGIVNDDGGSTVTVRGVCWDTVANPTTNLTTKTTDFSNIGNSFFAGITGLSSNRTYYLRAYATNSIGTGYGDEITFTTELGIGDAYQGGIIAYILQSGDPGYSSTTRHGLIAAPSDQSTSAPWSLTLTTTNASSQLLGSGQANTNTIVSNQGSGAYAAKICDDLVLGGYSDWYLPSLNELNKLYENRVLIGGFAVAFYWSSSEDSQNAAWVQSFNTNSQSAGTKTDMRNVRAIRSF